MPHGVFVTARTKGSKKFVDYKALLRDIPALIHVLVEVNQCGGIPAKKASHKGCRTYLSKNFSENTRSLYDEDKSDILRVVHAIVKPSRRQSTVTLSVVEHRPS